MPEIAVPAGIKTKIFILDENALAFLPEVHNRLWKDQPVWMIADGNTWKAAGEKAYSILKNAGISCCEPLILPAVPKPHPEWELSCRIAEQIPAGSVPFAIGSGVINDLVKCAAGIREVTYCCVATAPSVDGYTSSGAALSVAGFKKTVPCPPPAAVVADSGVLASAPHEMAVAGYGDLATKVVAGADWIIADMMKEDPIVPSTWDIVQKDLRSWLEDPADLEAVFLGLAATGYSMQCHKDSRPASGAEHMMSHVWEMEGLSFNGEEVSHGNKVSVGTMVTLKLMQFVIDTPLEEAKRLAGAPASLEEREAELAGLRKNKPYGKAVCDTAMSKFKHGEDALLRRKEIWKIWDELKNVLRKQLGEPGWLEGKLAASGCPVKPEDIGLDRELFLFGIFTAQLIRNRYTILDLLYEAGLFKYAVGKLF